MRLVLKQILQCPFRETLRLMYLEAKVLELLTLQIAQFCIYAIAQISELS